VTQWRDGLPAALVLQAPCGMQKGARGWMELSGSASNERGLHYLLRVACCGVLGRGPASAAALAGLGLAPSLRRARVIEQLPSSCRVAAE
jgi:hypothetical protein